MAVKSFARSGNGIPAVPGNRLHKPLGGKEQDNGMKTTLKCNCGQRVFSRDVMQQGYYVRHFGPSYVYVKFRCSRCKKLGEQFIKQEDWEEGILRDNTSELSPNERARFESMGKISINEMVDFHFALEDLNRFPERMENE